MENMRFYYELLFKKNQTYMQENHMVDVLHAPDLFMQKICNVNELIKRVQKPFMINK